MDEERITVKLMNIPLGELLRYLAGLSDGAVGEQGSTVWLVHEPGSFGPLITREYVMSPGSSAIMTSAGGPTPVRDYFESQGMAFYVGADAYFSSGNKLVIRNIQEELDLLDFGPPKLSFIEQAKARVLYYWTAVRNWVNAP